MTGATISRKRRLLASLLLLGAALTMSAQGFKLYFANNVTDVVNFSDIESATSGLNWREVRDKEIAGNIVEVDAVKQMFASPDLKYRAQQQQFWRMRDHNLLCFRIDDGTGGANSYQVEVEDTLGRPKAITVNRFFFLNVMRQENPITVKVASTDNPDNAITFKYYVADWDDDNLYTFQLDSKRRLADEVYRLEYRYSYADDEGTYQVESRQLALRDSAFQSFYIADNQTLLDVFLMSNDHKLRLDKSRLHRGVTLDPDYERTVLSTRFTLDKHENRELVNFNWIGSGLYERFDTLYLNIINERGAAVTRATIHVDAVDQNGNSTGVTDVKYLGYNRFKKAHLILTHGNPAYVEVLATGYCPAVYRYAGAADAEGIVDLKRCNDVFMLFDNPADDKTIAISSQHLYTLNDTHNVEVRFGRDYSICDIADYDLSKVVQADTVTYMEDAGNDWPKTLDGRVVERLAQAEFVFSSEASADAYGTTLVAIDTETGEEHLSRWPDLTTVYARNHPGFTRDYYFAKFNLVDVIPHNTMCSLRLQAGDKTFERFPYLRNLHIERERVKQEAENHVKDKVMNQGDDSPAHAFADQGVSMNMPFDFKMNLGPLFKLSSSINYDMLKQKLTATVKINYKRQDDDDISPTFTAMRQEAKEFLYEDPLAGSTKYKDKNRHTYNNVGDTRKFDDWFTKEMDDICSVDINKIGLGFFGSGKVKASFNLETLIKKDLQSSVYLEELSGTIGYGLCVAFPNMLESYFTSGPVASLLSNIPFFHVGGVFEASVQGDFGLKTFNMKYPMSWENFGAFFTLSAKIKCGLWAELCMPSNPVFAANLGLRGGAKVGIMGGFATPFQSDRFCLGMYAMAGIGLEAYASVRALGFQWSGRANAYLAKQFYYPNDGTNPLHPSFPYWLTDSKAKTIADSYRRLPAIEQDNFGFMLVNDVAADANPHFVDEYHVVYNDLADPADYNDDRVSLVQFDDASVQQISSPGYAARNHMRSKRNQHEIVVYEQLTRTVDPAEIQADHAVAKTNELAAATQIVAAVRQGNGEWKHFAVTHDDGLVDSHPVVTIQDDGKAACVYQHGTITSVDDTIPEDSVYSNALNGQLLLTVFDGAQWSQPVALFDISADVTASDYDLMMRNDTVLVGTTLVSAPLDPERRESRFVYSSVDLATMTVTQKAETLKPSRFFMNRVGQHAVIAILHEKTDSLRDIYVKTLSMNGYADGLIGADIGANYCTPNRIKIITDRAAPGVDHFAILWTEVTNNAHLEDGSESFSDTPRNVLNASRISLKPSPFITAPLTVGSDRDSLTIMDFDGMLDDARIKVVYSLADIESGAALVMGNECAFVNSFDYDIGYATQALLGSPTLPVSVVVANTGTSSIRSVTADINGVVFDIPDSYVAPLQKRTFVVQYPIPEDFDGYITNAVTVDFDNVFGAQYHPRRRNINMRRQTKSVAEPQRIAIEDVSLRLMRHTVGDNVNTYLVELTDNSPAGLKAGNAIHVGLYPHPSIIVPVSDQAETIVTAADFTDYGGRRVAYATVTLPGVNAQAHAYLTAHIFDTTRTDDDGQHPQVLNNSAEDNAHYVALLPHHNPDVIRELREQPSAHTRVRITTADNGITLHRLSAGAHVRVFNAQGILIYSKKTSDTELFVPLTHHDTYLISTGSEILKMTF